MVKLHYGCVFVNPLHRFVIIFGRLTDVIGGDGTLIFSTNDHLRVHGSCGEPSIRGFLSIEDAARLAVFLADAVEGGYFHKTAAQGAGPDEFVFKAAHNPYRLATEKWTAINDKRRTFELGRPIAPPLPMMNPTCLLDLCKWVPHEEDDPYDDNPGRVHTLYLLQWDAETKALAERAHLDIFYKRIGWESNHYRYKRHQTDDGWRVAFLTPPDFDGLFVFEFPTGSQASLLLSKSLIFDPSDSFEFDARGSSILFQQKDRLRRWRFVLQELDEYESRLQIIPDSSEI